MDDNSKYKSADKLQKNTGNFDNLIIFDGVCILCSAAVRFILRYDHKKMFHFTPLQSEYASEVLKTFDISIQNIDTIVLIRNKRLYFKSNAVLKIAGELSGVWKYLRFLKFIPEVIRDSIYSFIANHRYRWFGKNDQCLIPTTDETERFIDIGKTYRSERH